MLGRVTGVAIAAACLHACAAAPRHEAKLALPSAPPSDADHASAPLYFEVWASTHGSAAGPLFPEMALRSGDRIGVGARTSCSADVYLLHCDRLEVLSVYPESGPVHFAADQRVTLPAPGMDLQLSKEPGHETLYIVASKHPLERADPVLQAALALKPSSPGHPGCGVALERALRGPQRTAAVQEGVAMRGVELPNHESSVTRVLARDDGIVVLRFPYRHLP